MRMLGADPFLHPHIELYHDRLWLWVMAIEQIESQNQSLALRALAKVHHDDLA
jgi:hypothetical protein